MDSLRRFKFRWIFWSNARYWVRLLLSAIVLFLCASKSVNCNFSIQMLRVGLIERIPIYEQNFQYQFTISLYNWRSMFNGLWCCWNVFSIINQVGIQHFWRLHEFIWIFDFIMDSFGTLMKCPKHRNSRSVATKPQYRCNRSISNFNDIEYAKMEEIWF